jgi:hypothetical protein
MHLRAEHFEKRKGDVLIQRDLWLRYYAIHGKPRVNG